MCGMTNFSIGGANGSIGTGGTATFYKAIDAAFMIQPFSISLL